MIGVPHSAAQKASISADESVIAFAQTEKGRVLFSRQGAFIGVPAPEGRLAVFQLGFSQQQHKHGLMPKTQIDAKSRVNYFSGNRKASPEKLSIAQLLSYGHVWPGIDLSFKTDGPHLVVQIQIAPKAPHQNIALETGARQLLVKKQGLVAQLAGTEMMLSALTAHQQVGSKRHSIPVSFKPLEKGRLGFQVDEYDKTQPLVMSAVVSWSTFWGGSGGERGRAENRVVRLNSAEEILVGGNTDSGDFPVRAGAFDTSHNGKRDVFISKFSADGRELIFSTFLGSSEEDYLNDLVLDSEENLVLTGTTEGTDFPITEGAYDAFAQDREAFVAKLNTTGTELIFSTFLGGHDRDEGNRLFLSDNDEITVVGTTESTNFPTTHQAANRTYQGDGDLFFTKLTGDGKRALSSGYFGGSSYESLRGAIKGPGGSIYITGESYSTDLPTTPGVFGPSSSGDADQFIVVVSPVGDEFEMVTYIGGSGRDVGTAMGFDHLGNLILGGYSNSTDYPVTPGAFSEINLGGYGDWVMTKLTPNLSAQIFGTYFGGFQFDELADLIIDESGLPIFLGSSYSLDFPTTPDAYKPTYGGSSDICMVKLNETGSDLIYSSYFGGSGSDYLGRFAKNQMGEIILAGSTSSADFPLTAGQITKTSIFVSKLSSDLMELRSSYAVSVGGPDKPAAIQKDSEGNILVVGYTQADTFPTTAGVIDRFLSSRDGFVTKLDSKGEEVLFSTYLGGSDSDQITCAAFDTFGNVFVAGLTSSPDFPTTDGAIATTINGSSDAFVTKLDSTGTSLLYSTFLGGSGFSSFIFDIAVGTTGEAYVVGHTREPDFPTTPGVISETWQGENDVFIAKINPVGSLLSFSTFFGGGGFDSGTSIELDNFGQIVFGGRTTGGLPVTAGVFDESFGGSFDGFIAKMNQNGTQLIFSTYLGDRDFDQVYDLQVLPTSQILATGTGGRFFPTTPGAFDPFSDNDGDAFVSLLAGDGSQLLFSTSLGGRASESGSGVSIDQDGNMVVVGTTRSTEFPVTTNAFDPFTQGTSGSVFVSKFDCTLSTLVFSSFLSGSSTETSPRIQGDGSGQYTLMGTTKSPSFPTTLGVVDREFSGDSEIFLTQFDLRTENTFTVDPVRAVQGVETISFNATQDACSSDIFSLQWIDESGERRFPKNQALISLDPAPDDSGIFRLDVINQSTGNTGHVFARALVSRNPQYFDFNGDGCNNEEDIQAMAPQWLHVVTNDPNGDGFVDIRDFLFINTSGQGTCP